MKRKRRFLTLNEQRAEHVLSDVAAKHGLRIYAHVKLSHVVDERPAGVTDEQWQYATRAELDFVVVDGETREVEFAVELDDLSHLLPKRQLQDRTKELVCEADGLELLRAEFSSMAPHGLTRGHVGILDTRTQGRLLVEYLIDARGFMDAWDEAVADGSVPPDEPGDYRNIIDVDEQGRLRLVNDLSNAARLKVIAAHKAGRLSHCLIDGAAWEWRSGHAEGWAWLHVRDNLFLFQRTILRCYRIGCGMPPTELASDLAAAAIGDQFDALDRSEAVLVRAAQIQSQVDEVRARRDELVNRGRFDAIDHLNFAQ